MAQEYIVEGPKVGDFTKIDTTPQFALGTRIKTMQIGSEKTRTYRYVKVSAAFTAYKPAVISSVGALLFAGSTANAGGQYLAVPHAAITSPSGSQFQFLQTGGYFDNTGMNAAGGIYVNSAAANSSLYLTGTAGTASTTPAAIVMPLGGNALSTGSSGAVDAFVPDELFVKLDSLA